MIDTETIDALALIAECEERERTRAALWSVYGPGGTFEHDRKALLATIADEIRQTARERQEKMTEAAVDDAAHHDARYTGFLATARQERTTMAYLDAEIVAIGRRIRYAEARTWSEGRIARLTPA